MWIIRNVENGRYVARPGSYHSYTSRMEEARIYGTREKAESDACPENEQVIDVRKLLRIDY